jgi:hypothetical protein
LNLDEEKPSGILEPPARYGQWCHLPFPATQAVPGGGGCYEAGSAMAKKKFSVAYGIKRTWP